MPLYHVYHFIESIAARFLKQFGIKDLRILYVKLKFQVVFQAHIHDVQTVKLIHISA